MSEWLLHPSYTYIYAACVSLPSVLRRYITVVTSSWVILIACAIKIAPINARMKLIGWQPRSRSENRMWSLKGRGGGKKTGGTKRVRNSVERGREETEEKETPRESDRRRR